LHPFQLAVLDYLGYRRVALDLHLQLLQLSLELEFFLSFFLHVFLLFTQFLIDLSIKAIADLRRTWPVKVRIGPESRLTTEVFNVFTLIYFRQELTLR